MSENNTGNTQEPANTKGTYQPSEVDLRFLKAVDYVIKKHKAAKVKPYTDNAISKAFFGNRTIIGQIRSYRRGITMAQLQKFAGYFGLDFNYFFRGTEPMVYQEQTGSKNRNVDIAGRHIKNVDIISDTGGNVHKGDVHNYNGQVGKVIEKVDKIMDNTLNTPQSMELWNHVKEETVALEALVISQKQDMEEIVRGYQERLHKAEKERDQAREKQREISEKYINLLEQKIDT